ncbi:MAG: hypothetical protein ACRCW2_14745 [Cellulosilyticaceae bacterium]
MAIQSIKSHWGTDLAGKFTEGKGNKLCVILPGIAYLLDRSYLEYSKDLASQLGYDVLEVEYGFQVGRSPFDVPTEFDIVANETCQIVDRYMKDTYEHVLVIGKSIGTAVQIKVNEHLACKVLHNVAISPINKTAAMGMIANTLVVTSTSDPLLSQEALEQIQAVAGVEVMLVDNANHALGVAGNVEQTVAELGRFITRAKAFIEAL